MRACVRVRERDCVTERLGGAGGWEAQIAEAVDRLLLDVATDPAAAAAAANPFAALAAALPNRENNVGKCNPSKGKKTPPVQMEVMVSQLFNALI